MAFVLILSCTGLKAQNVKQDAQGNYVAIHHAKDTVAVKTTGKTYTDSKGKFTLFMFLLMENYLLGILS